MNMITKTILSAILGVIGTGIAYGAYQSILLAGDARWVRQDAWIQQSQQAQRQQLQRDMVPLVVKERKGTITDVERALLETYRAQLQELKK